MSAFIATGIVQEPWRHQSSLARCWVQCSDDEVGMTVKTTPAQAAAGAQGTKHLWWMIPSHPKPTILHCELEDSLVLSLQPYNCQLLVQWFLLIIYTGVTISFSAIPFHLQLTLQNLTEGEQSSAELPSEEHLLLTTYSSYWAREKGAQPAAPPGVQGDRDSSLGSITQAQTRHLPWEKGGCLLPPQHSLMVRPCHMEFLGSHMGIWASQSDLDYINMTLLAIK